VKIKKIFVDGRTDGRTDEHLRHTSLGRLGGVDLKSIRMQENMQLQIEISKFSDVFPD